MTARAWCFTINNYVALPEIRDGVRYLTFGREVAPTTGTPHLQGYVYYDNSVRLARVRKDFPGAHIEKAKGSFEQNQAYCQKDGDFVELGVPPATQKQKGEMEIERWELARTAAKAGDLDSIPADLYCRLYRTWKEISKDHMVKPDDLSGCCGFWIYGPSGAGKSRGARKTWPGAYDKMCNKWWDGYQGEEFVLLDDFDRKHDVLGHHLKRWADRFSFLAETKGGAINIRPKAIIVTSQYTPDQIWMDDETREAIGRRFTMLDIRTSLAPYVVYDEEMF